MRRPASTTALASSIFCSYHHITISPYHHVIISSYHLIIIPPYHHITMSPYHHIISSYHHIIISSYHHIQNPNATFRRILINVPGFGQICSTIGPNPGTFAKILRKLAGHFFAPFSCVFRPFRTVFGSFRTVSNEVGSMCKGKRWAPGVSQW